MRATAVENPQPDVHFAEFGHGATPKIDWLSEGEQQRMNRFATVELAERWAAGRTFVKRVLTRYLNCDPSEINFQTGRYGRPSLYGRAPSEEIDFNLSHASKWICVVVASRLRVGIDIEELSRSESVSALANAVLCDSELAYLQPLSNAARGREFLRLWTRKEALLKACGLGLNDRLPIRRISAVSPTAWAPTDERGESLNLWHWSDVDSPPGTVCSLASGGPTTPRRFLWVKTTSPVHLGP